MRRIRELSLNVVLPLAAGGALYAGWRSESLLGWAWAERAGAGAAAHAVRAWLRALGVTWPDVLVYTLPDALWVYALTYSLARLHARSSRRERALVLAIPVLLGPIAELCQLAALVPGTFDPLDLLATTGAIVAAHHVAVAASASPHPGSRRAASPRDEPPRALENA